MLTHIYIRDLATIEELNLNLSRGTTMITGETGAGKSIFIEAIELALGGRASPNLIRRDKEKAEITLSFDVSHFPKVIEMLKQLDLYQENAECIIRRVILRDGKSRSYINGSPSTLQLTKELGDLLFHLHGQYDQQVLLKTETQREMLDRFADLLPLSSQVKTLAEKWRSINQQIITIKEKCEERIHRSDYLRFQLEELHSIELKEGVWEKLEQEHHKLTHREELLRQIQQILQIISNSDNAILHQLKDVRKLFENIKLLEPKAIEWISILQSVIIQISELDKDLSSYLEKTEIDPLIIQQLEEKVSKIFNLARKHKILPQELFQYTNQLNEELITLNASDETLLTLENEQREVEKNYLELAKTLSNQREKAAKKLEKEITTTIRSLSLPHGEFKIALEKEIGQFPLHGNEKIIFLIKTNPDQDPQVISKVISGGELSRLSLAAHLALANRTTIPTLIFDEVDTGLSGATAEKIGKLLKKLGDSYQVFCVTHQAQVASCAHHHLLVEKYFIEKITYTNLRLLSLDEKTREIARMLGGEKITEKTLAHAKEVLQNI